MCDITFDQSAHAVFSLAVKHLWFSVVWSFRNFCVSPFEFASRNLISFEFVIKWRQSGLSRSQMRSWIRRRKRKSEYKVEDCVRSRVIQNNFFQTSNSDLLDSASLHERIDEHLSKFIFNWHSTIWLAPTNRNSQVWEDYFQASRDIWTIASHFLMTLCVENYNNGYSQ